VQAAREKEKADMRVRGWGIWVGVVMVLVSSGLALALHGQWQDRYTTAGGVPCCGVHDCVKAHVRLLVMQAETVTVEINEVELTIPAKSFHTSEDSTDWWCAIFPDKPPAAWNTRCVFLAVGS